ncbi:MAG: replication factor C large subunit, partial [Candidatus Bathyarchaeia archaeon]
AKISFIKWLKKWNPGEKAILLHGPPGVGKTTLVQVAAKAFSYDLIEMNASDTRTADKIMKIAGRASSEESLLSHISKAKGTIVLFDEVDGIYGREDQGGIGAITALINESKIPVVLVANDITDMKLREVKNACTTITFHPVRPAVLFGFLANICEKEKIDYEKEALKIIIDKSGGDVRSAVNDLQSFSEVTHRLKAEDLKNLQVRDKQLNIHGALQNIFLAENPMQTRKIVDEVEIDYEMFIQTLHDNLPYQYKDPEDLAAAYNSISRADVFLGRIKKSRDYGLLRYALEEMSVGVAASRKHNYAPVAYKFPPSKLILLSKIKAERQIRDEIGSLIATKCHVSRSRALTVFLPFLKIIFKADEIEAQRISSWLNFNDEMHSYLTEKAIEKTKTHSQKTAKRK